MFSRCAKPSVKRQEGRRRTRVQNAICFQLISGLIGSFFLNSLKVAIANGPDDRLNIDDCSFGIKGIRRLYSALTKSVHKTLSNVQNVVRSAMSLAKGR